MLVVISIIAILSSIIVVAVFKIQVYVQREGAKTELSTFEVGFDYYYEHFKEYPYDFDNFDGDPNINGYRFEGKPCPDYGLLGSVAVSNYLRDIENTYGSAEREVVVANIVCVWALSYRDAEKDIGPFVTFDEGRLEAIGEFTDNKYIHIDNDKNKPYKSKYGNKVLIYNDSWGKPYVFDVNWRWNISANPNVNTISRDGHDYVGRRFCGNQDSFVSISPTASAAKDAEFFRRGHWLRKKVLAPVDIWTRGPDGENDPNNNGRDDNKDDVADDADELVDDIVSWN